MVNHRAYISFQIYILLFTGYSSAQELEPRSYTVIPKGLKVAALSYTISHGNVVADATSPIQDLKLTSSVFALGHIRTFGLFGKLAKVQLGLPYVFLSGGAKINGVDTSANRSGFGDARLKIGLNLLGSPAMAPKDFQKFNEETVLGTSIIFSIPVGQYWPEKVINIGTNRWGFKPEIGFSRKKGSWYFETYAGVWFFTRNNDFLKTSNLDQEPIFSFQAHVSHLFPKKSWVAINGGYADGGQTTINGVHQNNFQKNWRLGGTYSMPLSRQSSIRAIVHTGVATRAGGDFTALTVAYTYSWF
ncbi:MAG TPA: transporter [Chitinophagaceae bacterium]|nr:transporter [Chitinophagaceae bacterium]